MKWKPVKIIEGAEHWEDLKWLHFLRGKILNEVFITLGGMTM